jgi:hypothetical protein
MDGQGAAVEQLRAEARQAALEAAEVVRKGDDVLERAHAVAQAIQQKVRQTLPSFQDPRRAQR